MILRDDVAKTAPGWPPWWPADREPRGPTPCAGARHCTTRQHDTHRTESRELLYAWHPWSDRKVFIHNAVDKNQQTTLRCSLEPIVNARLIEIPQWMFDAASLCGVRWADTPTVSGEALLELKALLSSVGKQRDDRVLQAQQPSLARTGETDAKVIKTATNGATEAISSADRLTLLGHTAERDPPPNTPPAGSTPARAQHESRRSRGRQGGRS
jgi:hypothetical protein